jgi:hypothetical protein
MKKNKDEPNWAIMHIYMKVPEEKSPCSYLKQAKMSFFFSSYEIGEQEGRTGPAWKGGGLLPVGVGRMWGKGVEG